MRIIIMSGLPGSGKSHYVYTHYKTATVLSTDNLHMVDGVYVFQKDKLQEYHNQTLRDFVKHCAVPPGNELVVDNTNVTRDEFMPYIRVGEAFGHEVAMVRCVCSLYVARNRQVHGVPLEVMQAMERNFEQPPVRHNFFIRTTGH